MASGGLGNLEHDSQLHREPEAVPGDEHPPSVAHTVGAEWRPRADDYQIEEGVEEESEQPSSLTENLSQRVQDEVGAENERGAGADDPNNYSLHSSWSFWFDR